jgi:hypothetical protein
MNEEVLYPLHSAPLFQSFSYCYNINIIVNQAMPQYAISSRFEKLYHVSVVNQLSEYLRQNEIHNKGTNSNIGYENMMVGIDKNLMNNSDTDIFSLFRE